MLKALAIWGLVAGACAFAPEGIYRIDPPAHYREIYQEAVTCTGHYQPYERIEWSYVPGHDFRDGKKRAIGHWDPPNGVAIAEDYKNIDWVVRHEVAHYVMQRAHWDGDTAVFGTACHAMWGYLPGTPGYRP